MSKPTPWVLTQPLLTMQSRTLPLPVGHPVKNLVGLARQIALPHEYSPERFPSFPALERTATMGFSFPTTITLPTTGTTKFIVSRQAAYPLWAEVTETAGTCQYVYLSTGASPQTLAVPEYQDTFTSGPYLFFQGNNLAGSERVGVSGATSAFSLTYPTLGLDGGTSPSGLAFCFLPANTNHYIVASMNTAAAPPQSATLNVAYEVWTAPGETKIVRTTFALTASAYSAIQTITSTTGVGSWVRPVSATLVYSTAGAIATNSQMNVAFIWSAGTAALTAAAANMGTVSITASAGVQVLYPIAFPVELTNSALPWFSTRTTAAACLFSNVTQVLNKAGTVLCGRVSPQVQSPFSITAALLNKNHPSEKAFLPLETGLYTFAPPSTDLTDFWDYTLPLGGAVSYGGVSQTNQVPVYRLDNSSLVNVGFFSGGSVAEALAVTMDWHLEFRTTSSLFDIGLSALTIETFHQAQLALAQVGYFFENPSHKKVLDKVLSAAKAMAPALATSVHPLLGAGVRSILLSRKNGPAPTTSAEGAGIVPKGKKGKGKPKPNPKSGKPKGGKGKKK